MDTFSIRSISPTAIIFGFLVVCILSSAHAAFIFDGNGFREINMTKMLEAAKARADQTGADRSARPHWCSRGDSLVREGSTWNERCRQCTCTKSGVQCTGPTCAPLPYSALQEATCAKWADQCCCSELGCMLEDGNVVPVNSPMPFDPQRPCHSCTCMGGNRTVCAMKSCWPYQCVDMVFRAGECCPVCPNGRTCVLPFQVQRRLSQTELRIVEPVSDLSPVTLFAGTSSEVTCACNGNLVATCTERITTPRNNPAGLNIAL